MQLEQLAFQLQPSSNRSEGQSARFSCLAGDGKPLSSIRLLRNEQLLLEGGNLFDPELASRSSIQFDRSPTDGLQAQVSRRLEVNFTIDRLSSQDAGLYHCVVSSAYGRVVRTLRLHVQRVSVELREPINESHLDDRLTRSINRNSRRRADPPSSWTSSTRCSAQRRCCSASRSTCCTSTRSRCPACASTCT